MTEEVKEEELFRTLGKVCKDAPPITPMWGYYIFRKAITAFVADPGCGKTTLSYGLGLALAQGKSFLGIKSEEPVNVLYMDLESSDQLINSRRVLLEQDTEVSNFYIFNSMELYFPDVAKRARDFCIKHDINLVFLDNQTTAFQSSDENDNSEAAKQMKLLRAWVNEVDCALVLVHHTSKANLPGIRKATGAFARARLADIMINLDLIDEDNHDVVCWEVVKNRMFDERTVWYLQKDNGQFKVIDQPVIATKERTYTKIYTHQQLLLNIMANGEEIKFSELLIKAKVLDMQDFEVDHAIHKLHQQGRVLKPKYGYWQLRPIQIDDDMFRRENC